MAPRSNSFYHSPAQVDLVLNYQEKKKASHEYVSSEAAIIA